MNGNYVPLLFLDEKGERLYDEALINAISERRETRSFNDEYRKSFKCNNFQIWIVTKLLHSIANKIKTSLGTEKLAAGNNFLLFKTLDALWRYALWTWVTITGYIVNILNPWQGMLKCKDEIILSLLSGNIFLP